MKTKLFILLFFLINFLIFSQQNTKTNSYYENYSDEISLDAILTIDDIESITIKNENGTYILNNKELNQLKKQFKLAKFAGSLQVEPSHISLSIELKTDSKVKEIYAYAYIGIINFENQIDKFGNKFSGTFYLPLNINFDLYK